MLDCASAGSRRCAARAARGRERRGAAARRSLASRARTTRPATDARDGVAAGNTVCLTIPYGAILALGGLLGLLLRGSVESFVVGAGLGSLLMFIGWQSYQDYEENKRKQMFKSPGYSYTVVSALLTLVVALIMGDRYAASGKFMPAGLVLGLSVLMLAFYAWKLLVVKDVGSSAKRASKVKD